MAAFFILATLAASAASEPPSSGPAFTPTTGATASARATVRILPGTKVRLGESASGGSYLVGSATVRDETGTSRPAKLVEFQ